MRPIAHCFIILYECGLEKDIQKSVSESVIVFVNMIQFAWHCFVCDLPFAKMKNRGDLYPLTKCTLLQCFIKASLLVTEYKIIIQEASDSRRSYPLCWLLAKRKKIAPNLAGSSWVIRLSTKQGLLLHVLPSISHEYPSEEEEWQVIFCGQGQSNIISFLLLVMHQKIAPKTGKKTWNEWGQLQKRNVTGQTLSHEKWRDRAVRMLPFVMFLAVPSKLL